MADDKKRLRVTLSPEHERMLQWLMDKWGLDRNATVGRIISETAKELEDQDAGKGKGDGERPRED
jgi:hypothetical protein